jgi:hypothetical protein
MTKLKREDILVTKEQFLHDLTVQLNLSVSDQIIREQLAYYDNYISGEVSKGRSESDVVEELGSPRLLAKTIIDTAEAAGDPVANQDEEIRGTIDTEPYSDALEFERDKSYRNSQSSSYSESENDEPQQGYQDENRREQKSYSEEGTRNDKSRPGFGGFSGSDGNGNYGHIFSTTGWGCFVAIIIFFLILQVLVSFVGGILYILSPYLPAIMAGFCIVWLINKFIR